MKLHPSPLLRPLPLLLLVAASGCGLLERPPLEQDFGAPYVLLRGIVQGPSGPVQTPSLDASGRLIVRVQFMGGCEGTGHRFEVDFRAATPERTEMWLVHFENDPCEDPIEEVLVLPVPEPVRTAERLVLIGPGEASFVLETER